MLDGLIDTGTGTAGEFASGYDAVHRLADALTDDATPADIVEPVFYEWYFRGVQLIKRGDLVALRDHAQGLSATAVVALARAGALGDDVAEPLAIRVPDGPISERPIDGAPSPGPAVVSSRDGVLAFRRRGRLIGEVDIAALAASGTVPVPGSRITFWQDSPALDRTVAAYQRDLARIHLDTTPFRVLGPAEVESKDNGDHVASFTGGLALIERCWPELYDEVACLTDHFTLIEGTPFIGGSAISCLGVSFFKLLPSWTDVCYADHIVHEAAHQRLHVEFEVEPALENGAFVGSASPIRRDPRPLHGVLHATFVFLRLSSFLLRVLQSEPTLEAERRLHRHALGLYAGLEQLERHGRWTPRGAQLFAQMRTAADHLREYVPDPDPQMYSKLGPDYEPVSALAAAYHD